MNRQARRGAALLALAAIALTAPGARADPLDAWSTAPHRHAILTEAAANADDIYLGLDYAYTILPGVGLAIGPSFAIRPYRSWVREPLRPHVYLQVHELRYLIGAAATEEVHLFGPFHLYGTLGAAYTAADFEGTAREPDQGWTALLDFGFAARFPVHFTHEWELRLGYRYADLRADETGWISAALGVRL
jgi:hypothetical protein